VPIMKRIVIFGLSLLIFAACHKDAVVSPQNSTKTTTSSTPSKTQTGGSSQTPPDTTPKLTHDDSIHMAKFAARPQAVKLNVTGAKLSMVFNENVDILLTEEGYQKTSAVHLLEDFTKTMLYGFDFTTVAEGGNTTFDWVDDNLNNVVDKTITDTTINKQKMVKINVHRPFTFSKTYSSGQDAQNEEALFAAKATDTVNFSSYSYYNLKNYPATSTSASMVYSK
jgi:hypothetical protein